MRRRASSVTSRLGDTLLTKQRISVDLTARTKRTDWININSAFVFSTRHQIIKSPVTFVYKTTHFTSKILGQSNFKFSFFRCINGNYSDAII